MKPGKRFSALWRISGILCLALGALFLISCGYNGGSAPRADKITFAYTATLDSSLAHVANRLGYFTEAGLDVVSQTHPLGLDALTSLLDGKAEMAAAAETPIMAAILRGEKIAIVATIQRSHNNYAVVSRVDRGIQAPRDLAGKNIGVSLGTSGDYFLDAFLAVHGLSRTSISVINLKPGALRSALIEGAVDAIVTLPAVRVQVEKALGNLVITFDDDTLYTQFFNVVTTKEFLQKNPEAVRKLLRALCKAEEFVQIRPEEAKSLMADSIRLDKMFVHEVWEVNDFGVSLDQSMLLSLEDQSRWAIRKKLSGSHRVPDYLDYIYSASLESVKPSAVRILK